MSVGVRLFLWLIVAILVGLACVFVNDNFRDKYGAVAMPVLYIALIAVGILFIVRLIAAGVKGGMRDARTEAERESSVPRARGFQVVTDGPGRYKIRGVDRQSGMDTSWQCEADSAANAKVKGELRGMIVTAVEYVGH